MSVKIILFKRLSNSLAACYVRIFGVVVFEYRIGFKKFKMKDPKWLSNPLNIDPIRLYIIWQILFTFLAILQFLFRFGAISRF